MSIIDKLARALDGLKSNDLMGRSGEKEKYCRVTADLICAPIIMNFSSFPDLLHKSMDSLFKMCDHSEANIRMVAEENLNRVVRCMVDYRKVELFVELLKEIKKNDSVRRLRAALLRFGNVCHLVSPSSRQKFVVFLIPCLKKIATRTEDQVAETLAQTFLKIMQSLGHIMSDSNIKMLLEAFVNNLVTDSSIVRRANVTCIEALCLFSKKPMVFFKHMLLINSVLIYDIYKSMGSERAWVESCVIIGLLNSVKNVIQYQTHICDNSYELKLESKILQKIYLQIFRFCCFTILHPDSSIVICALETLTQLFVSCPRDTLLLLVKKKMLNQTKLYETEIAKMQTTVNSIKIPRTLAQSLQKSFQYSSSESLETSFVQLSLPKFEDEPRSISQSYDSTRPSLSSANSMTNLYSEFGDDSLSEVDSIADNVFFSEHENASEFDVQSITSEHSCHSASGSVLQQELEFLNNICEDIPLNLLCVKIASLFLSPESSKSIRTGIKSSALGCLAEMLKIDSNLAFITFNSSDTAKTLLQISISYTNHEDHLLRGMAIKLVGTFIEVILKSNFGEFKIQNVEDSPSNLSIADLIDIITQGLKDDSYVCVCHSLSAVSVCLTPLLNSNVSIYAVPILEAILSGSSSYWLVKVKLLEIIENLSFMTMYFATNSSTYQDRILDRIVFKYLYDNEHSVRHAASKCLLSIVHNCYYKIDYMQQDVITSWVCSNTSLYCNNLLQLQNSTFYNRYIEASLSRVVNRLTSDLIKNQSAVVVAGCIEALTTLSNTYKSPEYSNVWKFSITKGTSSASSTSSCLGLLTSVLSAMTSTTAAFDLEMHCWMLKLSSNLITESIDSTMNTREHKIDFSKYNRWFENDKLKKYYNEFWKHVLKLLNMFRNVVLDYTEPTHSTPLVVQKSGENEKEKKNVRDTPTRNYYHKLQSIVKSSYNNYKVSIENTNNEKFIKFLHSVLDALKILLKFISSAECQQHIERILLCLTSVFNITPNYSCKVLTELFKCLISKYKISTNQQIFSKKDSVFVKNDSQSLCMYTQALQTPYDCLSNFIDTKIKVSQYANKRWEDERDRKTSLSGKLFCTSSENLDFSSNLKCFRPLTVKCLKEYIITGDVELQSSILDLLIALLQNKVNLNVIDPKHEFLNFIFGQFDYLENGLVRNPKNLISTMFQFLINLSEDKNQSNIIPEAIHLCDGLMASGYPPELYCIPAILPIVEYVYVLKSAFMVNSSDVKELEAQREMLFAMLLRLCQFNEVVSILSLVIMEGSEEKWKKQSRQLFDTLYTSLGGCKIQASLPSLINLLLTLHPSSYSVQRQLHVMFNTCYDVEKCTLEPWLNTVLSNLIIILIQKSEDLILLKISESDISISSNLFELTTQSDPLNASMLNKNKFPGEETFSKFLYRIIYLSTNDIILSLSLPRPNCESKVCLLSEFLLTCQYVVQSGNFPKVVNALRSFLDDSIFDTLHRTVMTLTMVYPLLVLHWVQFVGLLDYDNIEFWKSLLNADATDTQSKSGCCFYRSIVQKGCFLILCEVLSKNIDSDNELLNWFLSDRVVQLLEMGNENSALEFLNCVHKNPDLSSIHITAVKEKCVKDKLDLTNELLRSMNEAHPLHSGEVIKLILPAVLDDPHLALSQFASSIAIRKMEYLLALPVCESSVQLSKEETLQILEYFKNSNVCIKNRYCILISLFNKFGTQCYSFSSVEIDQNKIVNTVDLKNIVIDKNWFFDQVKTRCCRNDCPSFESAKLLSNLPLQDVISIMHSDNFNYDILQHCFTVSTQITTQVWKSLPEETTELELCPLFLAARFVLVEHIQRACSSLPRFHQIFLPMSGELNEKQNLYKTRMCQLFADGKFVKMITFVTPAVSKLLESVKLLSKQKTKEHIILMDSNKTLLKYTVLLFEALKWKLVNRSAATSRIQLFLKCAYNIFDVCELANELCTTELGSIVSTLVSVVEFITDDVLSLVVDDYYTETTDLILICRQISSLVSWVETSRPLSSNFQLNQLACLVIQIISRHPMVNGFVRVPPGVWKMLQPPANTVDFNIPAMPIDLLQEIDVLKQFVSRLGVVGWNSKLQFEETWMTLLSVLVPSSESDVPKEELISRIQASSAAVNGITQLFSQVLFKCYPGDTTKNKFLHISRDIPLDLSHLKWFTQLEEVNEMIYSTFGMFTKTAGKEALLDRYNRRANIERIHDRYRYSYHQFSVKFLQLAISDQWKTSNNVQNYKSSMLEKQLYERIDILNESGLDLKSCILLLKEVFNQWMESKTRGSLSQMNEMIKCLLVMSDLFTERDHYVWMLNVCLDLSLFHHHEDSLLHQYVIVAAAKAVAVSRTEDLGVCDKVLRLIDNGLKSNCRLTQSAALHGMLYLLEGCFIANNTLPNGSEIVQMAVDFVQKHLCTEYSMIYECEWQLCVISIAFYIVEHGSDNIEDSLLMSLEGLTKLVSSSRHFKLYQALMQGFQRIVFVKYPNKNIVEQITVLALDRLSNAPPGFSLPALQLLLLCIYAEHYNENDDSDIDPDTIVIEMEKISVMFERIKKGCLLEVEVTTVIMAKVLTDIFPASYVLMRVVGEFLSPNQPHPTSMCTVVNQIFEQLIKESQLDLLQDWVITTLSNFTQGLQIPMAIYCLISFFISSSTNKWLRAIFPHVRSRLGRYEYEDRKLLCIAAMDFYHSLSNENQKQLYKESFQSSVKSKNPFKDIVLCLE